MDEKFRQNNKTIRIKNTTDKHNTIIQNKEN